MNKNLFFAEIIQSSLFDWTGQCWQWDITPSFGSLLTIKHDQTTLYGIVHSITTGTNDPLRTPIAYQKTEEELLRDQPQIFEFLQTTFVCSIVGYQVAHKFFYHAPDKPPKIHAFIANATDEQYAAFFSSDQFLHMIFNTTMQGVNCDELLIAIIKALAHKNLLKNTDIQNFLETFSMICKHDYQKLKIFLNRIEPFLQSALLQKNT